MGQKYHFYDNSVRAYELYRSHILGPLNKTDGLKLST